MRILITGIHGFVGSNLVQTLGNSHVLYGLDIVAPHKSGVEKTFSWKDMEEGKIPEVDTIIHLAGKAHDTKNSSDAKVYFDINTGLTQKIFNFFLVSSAIKFIFFSSVKAAADSMTGDILTEDIIPSPKGPYGESKIKAEEYIQSKVKVSGSTFEVPGKKSVYILRPCMIHGPGNKGNFNLLYGIVKKGIPWPLGSFENRRSFTSIDNLCYVIDSLLTKDVSSGIYQISDDEFLSTNELIETICETMQRASLIWRLPKVMMKGLANFGDLLHIPLNSERLRKLTENYVVSNAKIKEALGIDKMPVRARDGLIRTIKSFSKK